MKEFLVEIGCGAIIGIANIIPGVSGGTMALILGFYEKLIGGINNISAKTIILFFRAIKGPKEHRLAFRDEFKKIQGPLLLRLLIGAVIAIFALAKLMSYLLIFHHDPTYGFFFGLVLVSAVSPWMLIKKKTVGTIAAFIIALVGLIAISESASREDIIRKAQVRQNIAAQVEQRTGAEIGNVEIKKHLYYFACGAISISAMILPGISGSFVLLLLGGYFEILRALSTFDFPVLLTFALGCILGLIAFVRFLHFLLERYYNPTMGFLLGLVIGSLWVIWPFKDSMMVGNERVYLSNVIPSMFGTNELATIAAFLAGALIVVAMLVAERKRSIG